MRPRTASILTLVVTLIHSSLSSANLSDTQVEGLLDARLVNTDTSVSWLDGGLGKTRYGSNSNLQRRSLVRLGEASLVAQSNFNKLFSGKIHLKADSEQTQLIDLVEGYIHFQPESETNTLIKTKIGVFFPPFSQENTGIAWTTPYSITNSAINSWIGEELKTVGAEVSITQDYEQGIFSFTSAMFRANDPAGSLLAWRGWAIHDRKSSSQDRLPLAPIPAIEEGGSTADQASWVEPFREIDGRTGFYTHFKWERTDSSQLQISYYDNRADETKFDGDQYAWHTRFTEVGGQYDFDNDVKFLAQYINGSSLMGQQPNGDSFVDIAFQSAYLLLTKPWKKHRLSARYDWFKVADRDNNIDDDNTEKGWSALLAYSYRPRSKHQVLFELMHINSERPARVSLGLQSEKKETILQTSYRLFF